MLRDQARFVLLSAAYKQTMMNTMNKIEDHCEPDKHLEIEEEKIWKAKGYAKDNTGKWIRSEGNEQT
jgi:hypothetical protein